MTLDIILKSAVVDLKRYDLYYDLYLRVQPRTRLFSRSKSSRPQSLQTTNPLIAKPLPGSSNCAWY